jgi:hypothetical protein
MEKIICKATTAKGKPCTAPAKYGKYCGRHKNKYFLSEEKRKNIARPKKTNTSKQVICRGCGASLNSREAFSKFGSYFCTLQCCKKENQGIDPDAKREEKRLIELTKTVQTLEPISKDKCPICLECDDKVTQLKVCKHWMHLECLAKTFKPECPVCRAPQKDVKVRRTRPSQEFIPVAPPLRIEDEGTNIRSWTWGGMRITVRALYGGGYTVTMR